MQTLGVLARIGGAELAALFGIAMFLAIIGFFLFWGGPPGRHH
ncbi:MAG TPA: hypothetical protein VJ622_07770 [Acidimicrobiia bacterium]|nr:hypothetical protein [Acidimicrobiia bacterium]HMC79767.1 hypothetical protein [Acidimicrobiia bacterium]